MRAPDGANENGSTDEVSGTGYFMGEFSGFEITIKSKTLYPDEPGNWAYYTFGHQPEPYNPTAQMMSHVLGLASWAMAPAMNTGVSRQMSATWR